jgi:hypothetical protein
MTLKEIRALCEEAVHCGQDGCPADRQFIAAARKLLPLLVDVAEAARAVASGECATMEYIDDALEALDTVTSSRADTQGDSDENYH